MRFPFPIPFKEHFIQVPNAQIHALPLNIRTYSPKDWFFTFIFEMQDVWMVGAMSIGTWSYKDTFVIDYRGYGKSTGTIESEEQLFNDAQDVYSYIQQNSGEQYKER